METEYPEILATLYGSNHEVVVYCEPPVLFDETKNSVKQYLAFVKMEIPVLVITEVKHLELNQFSDG